MQFVAQVSQNQITASSTQKRCRTQRIASINSQLKALQGGVARVALLPALASAIPGATPHVPDAPDLVLELVIRVALVAVLAPAPAPVPAPAIQVVLEAVPVPAARVALEIVQALVARIAPLLVLMVALVDALALALVLVVDATERAALDVTEHVLALA